MRTGFPTFRGLGLDPQRESRLHALLAERCRATGIAMGTLEASELAAAVFAADLRENRAAAPHSARPCETVPRNAA